MVQVTMILQNLKIYCWFQIVLLLPTIESRHASQFYGIGQDLQPRSDLPFHDWVWTEYVPKREQEHCWQYNWHGKLCVENGCYYITHDQTCVPSPEFYKCSPENTCSQHYGRPCDCQQAPAGCQPGGEDAFVCRKAQSACTDSFYLALEKMGSLSQCLRTNGYYLGEHGIVCQNLKESVCVTETTDVVFAVNLNGANFVVDSRGIVYSPDSEYDPYQIRVPGFVANKKVTNLPKRECSEDEVSERADCPHPGEVELYSSYITGNVSLAESDLCASYVIPILKTGVYELNIKLVNCEDMIAGEHVFSIKINEHVILRNFDVRARVKDCEAMELIVPFEVFNDAEGIQYRRYPPPTKRRLRTMSQQRRNAIPFEWDQVTLSFCFGENTPECQYKYTTFLVSAFFVNYVRKIAEVEKI